MPACGCPPQHFPFGVPPTPDSYPAIVGKPSGKALQPFAAALQPLADAPGFNNPIHSHGVGNAKQGTGRCQQGAG
ncbi:hypothetical protein TRAPUB_767 [Trametes pubescens]|uniref:Uncharacterized protein n=1 Tax=Trametes pubescens TaxID=154538 RepID=A0A1M2VL96_TRAPU|nr:hypothetical protein TRAPUB_767 [Trametes pubescens]